MTTTSDADTGSPNPAACGTATETDRAGAYLELSLPTFAARIWINGDPTPVISELIRTANPHTRDQTHPPGPAMVPGSIAGLISAGLLTVGQRLTWYRRNLGEHHTATVTADGRLQLSDGSIYANPTAAACAIAGYPAKGWDGFTTDDGRSLMHLKHSLEHCARTAPAHGTSQDPR